MLAFAFLLIIPPRPATNQIFVKSNSWCTKTNGLQRFDFSIDFTGTDSASGDRIRVFGLGMV